MSIKGTIWSAELDKLGPRLGGHWSGLGGGEPYGSGLSYPQAPGLPDRRVGELGLDVWLDPRRGLAAAVRHQVGLGACDGGAVVGEGDQHVHVLPSEH